MEALILSKRIVLVVGAVVASIVTGAHLRGASVPCMGNSDCSSILYSPFATIAGIPVAAVAILYFLAIWSLDSAMLDSDDPVRVEKLWLAGYRLQVAGLIVAVAFSAIGNLYLKVFCILCFTLSSCVLFSFFLSLRRAPPIRGRSPRRPFLSLTVILATIMGTFAYTATLSPQPKVVDKDLVEKTSLRELVPPDSHYLGDPKARNVVVVFSDMQCPACSATFSELIPKFRQAKGFKLVFRHRPLDSHEFAMRLATIAETAKSEEEFWKWTEAILEKHVWDAADYEEVSARLLTGRIVTPEVEERASARVKKDLEFARSLKIFGTPIHIVVQEGQPPRLSDVREILQLIGEPQKSGSP